jgi:hypothetical protein
MTYKVTWVATRSNTDVSFFYDAPEHAEQMAVVDNIRANLANMPDNLLEFYSKTYSDDNLTCTTNYGFKDPVVWQTFMSNINMSLPRGIIIRNTYFLDHGHQLILAITTPEGETGIIVQVP